MRATEILKQIKNSDIFEEFAITCNSKADIVLEEFIIKLYTAYRLFPIANKYDISENRYDNICELIITQYLENDISLDFLINAVYNYININKHSPSDKLLSEDVSALLEDYAEE